MRTLLFAPLLLTAVGISLTRSHGTRPMADGTTHFVVDFYRILSQARKTENILYSPLGVSLLLRTVRLGAKGKAHQEIGQLLRLQGNEDDEALEPLQTLFAVTSEEKTFTFNLANALYLQEGFLVKEQYLHSNKEFFQTSVKLVNFQNAKASAEAINTWVEKKTNGKIRNLIASSDLGPLTRLLLVNALFFKGNWKQVFRAEDTTQMAFTKGDHSIIKTPMMHLQVTAKFGSFSDHNVSYQVLELPYKGEEFSFVLILPGENVTIEKVEQLITAELIKDWFAMMEEEEVEISLPRFKIEHTMDLKEFLQPLNVTEIFNNGCDLSGITDSADLHISKAIQKVYLEVNEDGSEAAASTGMHVAAIMSLPNKRFVANRPFLFMLKHNPTESIILMGKLDNPATPLEKRRDPDSL